MGEHYIKESVACANPYFLSIDYSKSDIFFHFIEQYVPMIINN